MESQASAQAHLDALAADRERVASRMVLPWWHYAGWSVAVFVLSNAGRVPDRWFALYPVLLLVGLAMFVTLWRLRRRRQGLRMLPRRSSASRSRQALNWLAGIAVVSILVVLLLQVERTSTELVVSAFLAAGVGVGTWFDDRRSAVALRSLS